MSCSPSYQTLFQKYSKIDLASNTPPEQSQENISIKLLPINDNEYEKTWYKQSIAIPFINVNTNQQMIAKQDHIIYLYKDLTVFQVTIINNTDHILRMRDSRVVYIDPDKDEPIFAYDKSSMLEDVKGLPCFIEAKGRIANKNPISDFNILGTSIAVGVKNILDNISFVNGFNKEVMPGMKATGYIIFPIDPQKATEGKISFIDMVSQTDQTGNPVKKVRFDYKVLAMKKYLKSVYDQNEGKYLPWTEIDENEYAISQTRK